MIDNIDQLNNSQVFTELNKIIASIGDAHTTINYWDGYSYPLQFWIFDGNVYVVNAGAGLEDMVYSQVQKIDGVDIDYVIEQLTTLISHENESWVLAMLPNYLQSPVYMVGLGIVQKESEAVFTVQKDGKVQDFTVSTHGNEESIEYIIKKTKDVLIEQINVLSKIKEVTCRFYSTCNFLFIYAIGKFFVQYAHGELSKIFGRGSMQHTLCSYKNYFV